MRAGCHLLCGRKLPGKELRCPICDRSSRTARWSSLRPQLMFLRPFDSSWPGPVFFLKPTNQGTVVRRERLATYEIAGRAGRLYNHMRNPRQANSANYNLLLRRITTIFTVRVIVRAGRGARTPEEIPDSMALLRARKLIPRISAGHSGNIRQAFQPKRLKLERSQTANLRRETCAYRHTRGLGVGCAQ